MTRTLRHYEEIGLLRPAIIDRETGYRFAWLEKEGYKIVGNPRAVYIDGIWNQEDSDKWLTIIQVPVEKN